MKSKYARGLRTNPCGITAFRKEVEEYWLPSYAVQSVVCSLGNLASIWTDKSIVIQQSRLFQLTILRSSMKITC